MNSSDLQDNQMDNYTKGISSIETKILASTAQYYKDNYGVPIDIIHITSYLKLQVCSGSVEPKSELDVVLCDGVGKTTSVCGLPSLIGETKCLTHYKSRKNELEIRSILVKIMLIEIENLINKIVCYYYLFHGYTVNVDTICEYIRENTDIEIYHRSNPPKTPNPLCGQVKRSGFICLSAATKLNKCTLHSKNTNSNNKPNVLAKVNAKKERILSKYEASESSEDNK